jgi:hypothetical protein
MIWLLIILLYRCHNLPTISVYALRVLSQRGIHSSQFQPEFKRKATQCYCNLLHCISCQTIWTELERNTVSKLDARSDGNKQILGEINNIGPNIYVTVSKHILFSISRKRLLDPGRTASLPVLNSKKLTNGCGQYLLVLSNNNSIMLPSFHMSKNYY